MDIYEDYISEEDGFIYEDEDSDEDSDGEETIPHGGYLVPPKSQVVVIEDTNSVVYRDDFSESDDESDVDDLDDDEYMVEDTSDEDSISS